MPRELSTERLTLRPFMPDDVDWHLGLLGERDAPAPTRAENEAAVLHASSAWTDGGIAPYVVTVTRGAQAVGYCGLIVGRATSDAPGIAYELFRRDHGNGYATEAATAVVAAAGTGRARLWSTVRAWNVPSLNVLAKLQFSQDHSTFDDRGELIWLKREL
ncbi:GNAT family N-acetyltransferase [Marisediminicola senii]|uniref:GNAT family N-acetyltransferase n=1 Tax=Marisediminicola senii TaxID=2711233 RepID=UPI0013ECD301|nr:GNAT family protein [Marisediminicola senii]